MRLILLAVLAQAVALPEAPAAQPPVAEASPAVSLLPALTMLKLEMVDGVSTRTTKRGDRFAIRLAEAIDLPGISLPAGTTGHGEVVHAQKAGAAGRAGELILAARCLEVKGVCLKLRSLKVAPPHATERSDLALAVGVAAGPVGFLISGGHRDVAAGTALTALTAENTPWPPQPVAPQVQQQEPKP
jgi:hypothetical protein